MESCHTNGLVKPSEWILLIFATVLLTAAFTNQRATTHSVPVEAKADIPVDETSPADKNAGIDTDTEILAAMVKRTVEPTTDLTN